MIRNHQINKIITKIDNINALKMPTLCHRWDTPRAVQGTSWTHVEHFRVNVHQIKSAFFIFVLKASLRPDLISKSKKNSGALWLTMPEQLTLQTSTLYFKIFYTSTFIMKDERVTNGRRPMYSNISFYYFVIVFAIMYRCIKQKTYSF